MECACTIVHELQKIELSIFSTHANSHTVRVENFEVFLISGFSWVAHHTKFIHVEGGINTS